MRVAVWILGVGIAGVGVASVRPAPESRAAPANTPRLYGTELPADGYVSSSSCGASSCHGRGHAGGERSEYLVWGPDLRPGKANDPHSRAYQVLYNPVSKRIADLLHLPNPAHETALCLKCHAVETVQPPEAVSEGVGCCGCHGPAKKWLTAHYQPGWKKLTNREKCDEYGFLPVRNLTARALNCAGCHVGDGTREVNHELIAAGHPRLTFEFAGLHAAPGYRKHWDESLAPAEFELRAWVIGQAVSLRNAIALLQERAKRVEKTDSEADWPEFAGYSCVSCHRAIRKDTPRPLPRAQQARGKSGWEALSVAAVDVAAEYTPQVFAVAPAPLLAAFQELRDVMTKGNPNPGLVRRKSTAALAELDGWLASLQNAEDRPARPLATEVSQRLLNALAASALAPNREALRDHDPDFLAAHAAGCRAVLRGSPDVRLSSHVKELVDVLPVPHTPNGRLNDWGSGLTNTRMLRVRDQLRDVFDRTQPGGKP